MFERVQTKKVYIEIVEQIQNLILNGKIKPGDRLPPERMLAEKLGVSRPPLREAMSALEILGIIECRGGKGNFVKKKFNSTNYKQQMEELENEESPFELLEARKVIETEIAALAAEKATLPDIAEVEKVLKKMENALDDVPKAMEFDTEFHIAVAKAAHNSVLLETMIFLARGLSDSMWVNIKEKLWEQPGNPRKYIKEHKEIIDAIKNKNQEGARTKMNDHLFDVEKDLLEE
jgi:GntR family transcriptional repressor for pyruvate dehydrogenase complex